MEKPAELVHAEFVVMMCERFHVLPSQLDAEDAGLVRMVRMVDRERERREGTDE